LSFLQSEGHPSNTLRCLRNECGEWEMQVLQCSYSGKMDINEFQIGDYLKSKILA
jgi:hypothetical protein